MEWAFVGISLGMIGPDREKSTTQSESGSKSLVRVYDYLDYRSYLRDLYEWRRAQDPRFSYRFIAARVGFKSASYFSQVLHGRSAMTPEMALRFSAFLRLDAREADYLELLVLHDRAKGASERRRYLEKLAGFRESSASLVPPENFEFFEHWYHTAVRELLHIVPFDGDFKALGKRLRPSIPASKAKASIELLLRLGMARREGSHVVRADRRSTTTGEAVESVQVDSFHASTLALAKAAIDGMPRAERSLSSLTVTLSPEARKRVDSEIAEFRRRILSIAESDAGETAVFHLGIQLFPMTCEVAP